MTFREKNKLLKEENDRLYEENKRLRQSLEAKKIRLNRLLLEFSSLHEKTLTENKRMSEEEMAEFKKESAQAQPCEDCVSREAMLDAFWKLSVELRPSAIDAILNIINSLPPITLKPRLCKDCKFFEYDSFVEVDGIPLIVAHETCKKWGGGCKTEEDGYCFLFEPKMEGEER